MNSIAQEWPNTKTSPPPIPLSHTVLCNPSTPHEMAYGFRTLRSLMENSGLCWKPQFLKRPLEFGHCKTC